MMAKHTSYLSVKFTLLFAWVAPLLETGSIVWGELIGVAHT